MHKRVLLVEDVPEARQGFKRVLDLKSFLVHEAANLQEALEAIDKITYHVVCIDLGLDDNDHSNYQGFEVLKALNTQNEGTSAIIVSQKSGGRAHDITIRAYEEYKLLRYLRKAHFSVEEFVEAVTKASEEANLTVYRNYRTPFEAILHELEPLAWEDRALKTLRPHKGFETLRNAVDTMLRPFAPLRPHKDPNTRAEIDTADHKVRFSFWSKADGLAATCLLSNQQLDRPSSVLKQKSFSNLNVIVTPSEDASRKDYLP